MKKLMTIIASLAVSLLVFQSCEQEPKPSTPDEPDVVHVQNVSASASVTELIPGQLAKINVTITPANASDQSVTYTTDNSNVVAVDSQGNIMAQGPGTATITVTTKDGSKVATVTITVKEADPVAVTGVTLNETSLELTVGDEVKLVATVEPSDATDKEVTWSSSDEEVATVDQEGNVKVVKDGEATITVTTKDGGKTASCQITAAAASVAVTGIEFTNGTNFSVSVSKTARLIVKVLPEDANNKEFTVSIADPTLLEVDHIENNGGLYLRGLKAGTTDVTVTTVEGAFTATTQVTVKEYIPLTSLSFDKSSITIVKGEYADLTVIKEPANATLSTIIAKSSDKDVAVVGSMGNGVRIWALKPGTTTITYAYEGIDVPPATCEVTVVEEMGKITSISFDKTTLTLGQYEAADLSYTIEYTEPMDPFLIDVSSSDNDVASVQVKFVGSRHYVEVQANNPGTCTISLSVWGSDVPPATCEVTVTQGFVFIPVESFEFTSGSNLTLDIGETGTAHLKMIPADASFANFTVYVSDFSVIDVSRKDVGPGEYDYVIKGLKPGTATLTISIPEQGNISATATVTVKEPVHVTTVRFDRQSYSIPEGQKQTVTVRVYPTNAANPNIMFGVSDMSVVKIESSDYIGGGVHRFVVKGLKPGTSTINVITEDGEFKASATVTVTEFVALTGITFLNGENFTISETETATIQFRPIPINASNTAVTAAVSDPTVLQITQVTNQAERMTVYVKGLKEGTTTLTVTTEEGGYTATANVTVTKYNPIKRIYFDKSTVSTTYSPGAYVDLILCFDPEDATYPENGFKLDSSNKEVAVTSFNALDKRIVRVFPLEQEHPGTTTITATIVNSDVPPATCEFTVLPND